MKCSVCDGPIRSDNKVGICTSNRDCYNAWQRARTPGLRDSRRERTRAYRRDNPDYFKMAGRKYLYGVTSERWQEMCVNGCWICGDKESKLIVDHDHSCCPGRKSCKKCVRGALCLWCNLRLGYAERNQRIPLSEAETRYLDLFKRVEDDLPI